MGVGLIFGQRSVNKPRIENFQLFWKICLRWVILVHYPKGEPGTRLILHRTYAWYLGKTEDIFYIYSSFQDLGLAQNAATSAQVSIPLGSLSYQLYRLLVQSPRFQTKDFSSIYQFLSENQWLDFSTRKTLYWNSCDNTTFIHYTGAFTFRYHQRFLEINFSFGFQYPKILSSNHWDH